MEEMEYLIYEVNGKWETGKGKWR